MQRLQEKRRREELIMDMLLIMTNLHKFLGVTRKDILWGISTVSVSMLFSCLLIYNMKSSLALAASTLIQKQLPL